MTMKPRPLVAGNWKMNGLTASLAEARALATSLPNGLSADVMLCPPATLVAAMAASLKGSAIAVGGQDCHPAASGANTGDISAEMLRDAGATGVIIGHSERRAEHREHNELVREKALAAYRAGLIGIICIGETRAEREAGKTLDVVQNQLSISTPNAATFQNTVIAYEPVWAIGTGLTPTTADVAEVHRALRLELIAKLGPTASQIRLLYGGSVKGSNAHELMAVENVDGALVGGASLKAADFLGILSAYTPKA